MKCKQFPFLVMKLLCLMGGGTFMTGTKSYTQAEIDALMPYNGLTVHNSTTNCINYYYINNWFEACGSCTPMPSQPMAGNDTIVVGGVVSLYLYANTPETGSALWSILSGEGGSFADITDPNTLFTGQPGTSYILQWAISTSCGTISDEVIIVFWQCSYPVTDSRDGQSYTTLQIGDQCWMTENLNIGTRIAGSSNQTDDGTLEKYCFDNSDANCDVYGGLYQWNEMMQYTTTQGVQGVCMEGWHLPTDDEWCALEQEVDPSITCSSTGWRGTDGGTKLKQGGSSGFEALLGGYRNTGSGSFNSLGTDAYFWSSSESGSNAWGRGLGLSSAYVYRLAYGKTFGFSVRCLKD